MSDDFAFDFESPRVIGEIVKEFVDDETPVALDETSEAGRIALELNDTRNRLKSLHKEQSADDRIRVEFEQQIVAIQADYRKRLRAIEDEMKVVKERIFDRRREINNVQRVVETLERKLKLALDKIIAGSKFQQISSELDTLTAGAPWREWAFDKQVECGKIIAANKRVLMGNKVGTGKSLTALIAADMLQVKRLLIVTPADVTRNFEREVIRWAPHRPLLSLYKLTKGQRRAAMSIATFTNEYTVTVNYEAWRRDQELLMELVDLKFQMVVLDESHNLKNVSSIAFAGIKKVVHAENVCPRCSGDVEQRPYPGGEKRYFYACKTCDWDSMSDRNYTMLDRCSVKFLLPMTGTPILNRPQELYPLLHLMMPHIFDNLHRFLDLYCEQDLYTGYWKWNSGGLQRLQHHLAGYYIAYSKEDMGIKSMQLPPVVHEMEFDVEKYPLQWKIIQQLTKHAQILLDSGKAVKAIATIALITRKRQANVWPAGISLKDPETKEVLFSVGEEVQESIKVDKAYDMITEELEDERIVVFSQFKGPLRALAERLENIAVVLDGDTPESLREQIKIDFDRTYCDVQGYEKKWRVVLCNFKTGGVGLNFTSATQTIVLDEEWNPGKNEQAYGRTDRIGQTQESTIHILRLNQSIDTWMASLNDHKANVVQGFAEATSDISTSLLTAMQNGEIL